MRGFKEMTVFRLVFVILAFASTSVFAQTESFTCQLKDFVILSMEDGKSERYGGFTDSYEVGDTFRIELTVDEASEPPKVKFDVLTAGKSLMLVFPADIKKDIFAPGDTIRVESAIAEYAAGHSYLEVQGLFSKLALSRYYKGDWHGLWTGYDGSDNVVSSYVGTLNCIGASRAVDATYNKLFELAKP